MFLRRTWETRRGGVRRWLALSAVAWAVFSLVGGEHGWLRERELRAERDRQEERVRALRTEIASVRHDLEVSKEDPIGRERFLRERLGLARPGETVYRWVDPSAGDAVLDRPQSAR